MHILDLTPRALTGVLIDGKQFAFIPRKTMLDYILFNKTVSRMFLNSTKVLSDTSGIYLEGIFKRFNCGKILPVVSLRA